MPSTLETLQALRNLLSDPERWAKYNFAYDADDRQCDPSDPRAVCWCLSGGLRKLLPKMGDLNTVANFIGNRLPAGYAPSIPAFNDAPLITHSDVLALLDRCIAEARCSTTTQA